MSRGNQDNNGDGGLFFLSAVPIEGNRDATWKKLEASCASHGNVSKFEVPSELRVGTLDSLVQLSDTLAKDDHFAEQLTKGLGNQLSSLLNNVKDRLVESLQVDGRTLQNYLSSFRWDSAKFNVNLKSADSLREDINKKLVEIDTEMKGKVSAYNKLKGQLGTLERNQTGSLLVRDVSNVVKPEMFVQDSEYLVTLLVVIQLRDKERWNASYEGLSEYVVPRSSQDLQIEDKDSCIVTVTLFRKIADDFKEAAREQSFMVKEFEFNLEAREAEAKHMSELQGDLRKKHNMLIRWCATMFSEAFIAWIHMKALRIFVESVLRYGLPVNFVTAVALPRPKLGSKLRASLNSAYAHLDNAGGDKDELKTVIPGVDLKNYHPYVSFKIDLSKFMHK